MRNLTDVRTSDVAEYARIFHAVLDAGYYLPPSQFEVGFISAAHTQADIDGLSSAILAAM